MESHNSARLIKIPYSKVVHGDIGNPIIWHTTSQKHRGVENNTQKSLDDN